MQSWVPRPSEPESEEVQFSSATRGIVNTRPHIWPVVSQETGNRILRVFIFCLNILVKECVCHLSHFSWLWGRTKVDWWKLKPTPGYFLFIYIECKDGSEHNGTALWKVAIQLFNKAVKELVTTSRVQFWTTGLNGFAIIWSSMTFILGAIMCVCQRNCETLVLLVINQAIIILLLCWQPGPLTSTSLFAKILPLCKFNFD